MRNTIFDSWIMFKRCLSISLRNPEALLTATFLPFIVMLLFTTIMGNMTNLADFNYVDFIVPGIIMQSIGQASQYSAMNVATDMTKGIIDRFRTMSISKSAVIIGHTGAGVVRNTIATVIIFATALVLGFRPQAGFKDWGVVLGLLVLVNIAMSLVSVLCGLIAKSAEGSISLMLPFFVLPFISSGFAPVETMTGGIRWFAKNQPMTPIIDSIRSLTLDLPLDNSLMVALTWCIGTILVTYFISLQVYKKKTA
ncbi:ABC transporter permease [Enterococcus sp. 669A]|uniref:Transport permease protein n=1 Tax=Candidatus Enterococcus moelleringii TaxID=2815325 RepID=A0ABS3LCP1_9ENTE|nr:ABC transporter permease [Enterococcus sp. 669A]MBO1307400.1 ABC transporter permease [Enterococcus sp. 669A]